MDTVICNTHGYSNVQDSTLPSEENSYMTDRTNVRTLTNLSISTLFFYSFLCFSLFFSEQYFKTINYYGQLKDSGPQPNHEKMT